MNMNFFDNIGSSFTLDSTNNFIIGPSLPGYSTLTNQHKQTYIPYLARNINGKAISWEIGVGYIYVEDTRVCVSRTEVQSSSNQNNKVDFNTSGEKQFYLFINSRSFNTGFNSVFIKDNDFDIENTQGIYIVDVSSGLVHAKLPDCAKNPNLIISLQTVGLSGTLSISDDKDYLLILSGANRHTSLVSTGSSWVELKDSASKLNGEIGSLSMDPDMPFSALSDPSGADRSIQFNDDGSFNETSVYWGSNEQLLFGSPSSGTAKHIIPSTGSFPLVINNTKNNSDFMVYGSGSGEKNLFFTYDGKLGINTPTGVRPLTNLHVFNTNCRDAVRIENKSTCYPADVSIYHNPSSIITSGTTISQIKLTAKDSARNPIDFVKLVGKAKTTTAGATKGEFNLVVNSGSSTISTFKSDPDSTTLSYVSGGSLVVSPTGIVSSIGSTSLSLGASTISIKSPSISTSGALTVSGSASVDSLTVSSGLILSNLESNVLLAVNNSKRLSPATGFKLAGVFANKILSSDASGTIVGRFGLDTFLASNNDILLNRYSQRPATACLRQLTFTGGAPAAEFAIGDQLSITPASGSVIFRTISEIEYTNPTTIASILLDQKLTSEVGNASVYSVTKGGYLVNQLYAGSGVASDATAIILSTRPNVDTIFNTKHKNINFQVYGAEDAPSLSILASAGFQASNSGVYFKFATQLQTAAGSDIEPFKVQVDANGVGTSSPNNSMNYFSASLPLWSGIGLGMATSVGTNGRSSYYGTFDQNGNVFEWVSDDEIESIDPNQKICGGSWRTNSSNGLRSIINTSYINHLDDVGFRLCCRYGLNDAEVQIALGLSFVSVGNIDNISDDNVVFTEDEDNRFGVKIKPEPTIISNLGKVDNPYQIGVYEITNRQYAIFLNAVGKTDIHSIYSSRMSNSPIGGIARSGVNGSRVYTTKANMADKPVVFVNYLSTIRFANWLHNGAPSGTGVDSPEPSITEEGAYTINLASSTTIIQNRDQKYWLPSLNQWHKAAYFQPIAGEFQDSASAVTIRRSLPYEVSSGVAASLSVADSLYSDSLIVGNSGTLIETVRDSGSGAKLNLLTGFRPSTINMGVPTIVTINNNPKWNGNYGTFIADTGITLAASGLIKIVSPQVVRVSGLQVDTLLAKSISVVNADGDIVQGGQYPGPNGGFIFKDLNGIMASASSTLKAVEATYSVTDDSGEISTFSGLFPKLVGASNSAVIYTNAQGYLEGYSSLRLGISVDDLGECVFIGNEDPDSEALPPSLVVSKIRIGPAIPSFSGTILTHNGLGVAQWKTADYLRADGMSWTRYKKRAIKLLSNNSAQFISKTENLGGTGAIDVNTILQEFSLDETIGITNASRETVYVKVSNYVLLDSDQEISNEFFSNEQSLTITFCPKLSDEFLENSRVDDLTGELLGTEAPTSDTIQLGYAFSVYKGAYLDMAIEPYAVSGFNCEALDGASSYRFKPSTANTLSIRPHVHTSFNKVAEDIDFAIYGYKNTLYNRYEPSLFGLGSDGLPSGLKPAFYVNVNVDNSCVGSIESGVSKSGYLPSADSSPPTAVTGITLDESAKLTINTKTPYQIATITATSGYNSSGVLVTGINPFSTYADLTVNGYMFGSGIISNDFSYNPQLVGADKRYVPNAPLTINSLGQLVSLIPPPPATIPDLPTFVAGIPGNASITLSWTAPVNDGGQAISDYQIEVSEDQGNNWTIFVHIPSALTTMLITGLNNNVNYIFRVSAKNGIGVGSPSLNSAIISPTSNTPSQPLNLVATRNPPNSFQVVLSWAAPYSAGATSITDYILEYALVPNPYSTTLEWRTFDDGISTALTRTITGLLNEPTYLFRVSAKNTAGNGVPSDIAKSVGSDDEPLPVTPVIDTPLRDNYNFLEYVFGEPPLQPPAAILRIKRDITTVNAPHPQQLAIGELAFNAVTGKLYAKSVSGKVLEFVGKQIGFTKAPTISFDDTSSFCCLGDLLTVNISDLKAEPQQYTFELTDLTNNNIDFNINNAIYTNYQTYPEPTGTGLDEDLGPAIDMRRAIVPINLTISGTKPITMLRLTVLEGNSEIAQRTLTISCNSCS